MTNEEILSEFQAVGAILHGHFQLTSGRHSDTYIQCARVLEYPSLTMRLAREQISRLPEQLAPTLVASPAVGGILYGFAIAAALDLPLIFSERVDGRMVFRRSFTVPAGARVLIAEDVVTTGGSVAEVAELVKAGGGEVVGVLSLIDRGGSPVFSAEFFPLLRLETPSWPAADCQLCAASVPLYAPGSRNLGR